MTRLLTQIRHDLRSLLRARGVTAAAVLTLAVGVAAVLTVFAVLDGVLLRPLPYSEPERLVRIDHAAPGLGLDRLAASPGLYFHYLDRSRTLAELGLYTPGPVNLSGGDEPPARVPAAWTSAGVFRALARPPLLGRYFSPEDDAPGGPSSVVLSWTCWQRDFGGRRDIVGRNVRIDRLDVEVIGVMPRDFAFPDERTRIWLPRRPDRSKAELGNFSDALVARLASGVTRADAERELQALTSDLEADFPEAPAAATLRANGFTPRVDTLLESEVGHLRPLLGTLLATVLLILVIAYANVANLFLVRGERRSRELAVRSALGASRLRIALDLVREATLLGTLGGAAGTLLAVPVIGLVARWAPVDIPRVRQVAMDGRVGALALALCLSCGFLFGWLPALRLSNAGIEPLRAGAGQTRGRRRWRLGRGLAVTQVALSLTLLVVGGLMLRSLLLLQRVDPGYQAPGVLTFDIALPGKGYSRAEERVRFLETLQERVEALSGVEQAGVTSWLPLAVAERSGAAYHSEIASARSGGTEAGAAPVLLESWSTPELLPTLGARLLAGRWLEERDTSGRSGSVLLSRAASAALWPGLPPAQVLGQRLTHEEAAAGGPWYTVVGVVDDIHQEGLDGRSTRLLYHPLLGAEGDRQDLRFFFSVALRSKVDPETLLPELRELLHSLDPELPITGLRPAEALLRSAWARQRFAALVLLAATATAMTIAGIGLYAVLAAAVGERTRELGIRSALGADRRRLSLLVLREGLTVGLGGVLLGALLALASGSLLDGVLFGVGPRDAPTLLACIVLTVAVALAASWYPASRAARVTPAVALRPD